MTGNVFAKSAKAAKDDMQAVMSGGKKAKRKGDERASYHTCGVRITEALWRKCQLHRVDTGESFNALVTRLLESEFSHGED